MLKAVGLFGGRSKKRPPLFKDYYAEWFSTLKTTLLPSLHQSLSDTSHLPHLSLHVDALHRHFQSYYDSLDAAAQYDVAQVLHPDWRNPLEKPFLFLADLHPYLFTKLLRSFLDNSDDESSGDDDDSASLLVQLAERRPWQVATAWRSPSNSLAAKIDQVECGLRLMVPALAARARDAQAAFVERVARNWGPCDGGKKEVAKEDVAEAMEAEMVSIVVDANRLRRSVLAEILGATSVYQAGLFLEGLAQFLVGFRNPELLAQFDQCKTPLSKQCRLAV